MDRNNRHGKRHHNSWKNQKPHTEYKEPVRYTNFQHITQEEFEAITYFPGDNRQS